ncbi:unnamed protein product [Ectocarpus sp. 6 AP-2014]
MESATSLMIRTTALTTTDPSIKLGTRTMTATARMGRTAAAATTLTIASNA